MIQRSSSHTKKIDNNYLKCVIIDVCRWELLLIFKY